MKNLSRKEIVSLLLHSNMPTEDLNQFTRLLIESGEITEADLAAFDEDRAQSEYPRFKEAYQKDELYQVLNDLFGDRENYHARALVKVLPDEFYSVGYAARVITKLRADLGTILLRPKGPSQKRDYNPVALQKLSQFVQDDLLALAIECRFRDYLYLFSRDYSIGEEVLREDTGKAQGFERRILEAVSALVKKLLAMEIPDAVTKVHGNDFPAMHVRWWLDLCRNQERVLNMADTGAHKTAFATLCMRMYGCERVLILCAANARNHWAEEIDLYFGGRLSSQVIRKAEQIYELDPDANFTIVGYPLLRGDYAEELAVWPFDGIIQDECHYTKNLNGNVQRALACHELTQRLNFKRYIALSATPWENRPEELAAVASILKPKPFGKPAAFVRSGVARSPRLLRELFADQMLEVELPEIKELPEVTPRADQDLFATLPLEMTFAQRRIYQYLHDEEEAAAEAIVKAKRLLMTTTHPACLLKYAPKGLNGRGAWPEWLTELLMDWQTSAKLVWLKQFIEARISTGKIVVASGLFKEGITSYKGNGQIPVVADLLREWYGEKHVLVIDGDVSLYQAKRGKSERAMVIERWRTDPDARILLVFMDACPDSINLSIGALPDIKRLSVTALSFGWKPWKQFRGRFEREGQAVPIEYQVPIINGTIDESLVLFNRAKWRLQRLFGANAALSDKEWSDLQAHGSKGYQRMLHSPGQHLNWISHQLRNQGEDGCAAMYSCMYGATTMAEAYARFFEERWDTSLAANVSHFQKPFFKALLDHEVLESEEILDAGCGVLRLARTLEVPCFSVDMNPEMLALANKVAPKLTTNASLQRLSQLPHDWTGKFKWVNASLVLDMTSLKVMRGGEPERLHILRELIRVCDPEGWLWLTWTEESHNTETFKEWCKALRQEGFKVREDSGLVKATDHPKYHCAFWSLVFTPKGVEPKFKEHDPEKTPYHYAFELERIIRRSAGRARQTVPKLTSNGVMHEQFEVIRPELPHASLKDVKAAMQVAARSIIDRVIESSGGADWRLLEKLRRMKLI